MPPEHTRSAGSARHARRGPGRSAHSAAGPSARPASAGTDILASLVVFLVALPLCIGVAAASGVPIALGIISGIIGGLVVGFLPGSSLQVSGPAAGLAGLCLEFTTEHGLALLGPVILASGLIQMGLGALKLGSLFQSISLAVVQGMLAGIGLPLMLSQSYAVMDAKQLGSAIKNIGGLPHLVQSTLADPHRLAALFLGIGSLAICFLWKKAPAPLSKVPAPLIAVMLGSVLAALPGIEVKRVVFGSLLDAVNFPGPDDFAGLADPAVITMVITFAIIASAESLFSAAAVDRMHDGPRTKYNAELFSQGIGNVLCGFLGSLPMTAVIARSSANVQAGAKTKISRVLHGGWLLGFGLLLPGLLGLIPVAVLAGILLHAGWKLFDPTAFPKMWKTDRGEGIVMIITTVAIVVANLLEGVLAGLAVAIVLVALRMSRIAFRTTSVGNTACLTMSGNATFLRLPKLIEALDSVAGKPRIHLDLTAVVHLDLACRSQVEEFAERQRKAGAEHVELLLPGTPPEKTTAPDHSPLEGDFPAGLEHPQEQTARFPGQIPTPAVGLIPGQQHPVAEPWPHADAGGWQHGVPIQTATNYAVLDHVVSNYGAPHAASYNAAYGAPHPGSYDYGHAYDPPEASHWTPEDERAAERAYWEGTQQ
ncbi:SulP family inorganic anion transporter [Streptomyces sp. NPDC017949]|uniref:SulP family inorganic anion transporter n=1 Tax=Streptomyces sp. NPDC017949 TaxID=3365020 RepID=UPI00378910CE